MKHDAVAEAGGNERRTIVPHLLSISKSVRQLVGLKLARCDIVVGQDQFLLCFADWEALSVAEIAARLSVRASTVSKMVDILSRKGWAERHAHDADGRKVLVRLTKAGQAARADAEAVEVALEAELRLTIGDDADIVPALTKLDAILAKRLSRLR